MMDEIICPACGRPNLAEAVKCWNCQELLESLPQSDGEVEPTQILDEEVDKSSQEKHPEPIPSKKEEEIPDWLKRIRALKEAEQQKEEERSRWQQQALFAGGAHKEKETGAHRERRKRDPQLARQAMPDEPAKQTPPANIPVNPLPAVPLREDQPTPAGQTEVDMDEMISEKDDGEDLPDGYVPFKRE